MISSTSLRLLQKTCGLFDTGLAGGADVTSLDAGVLTAVDQSLYSLEDLQPFNPQFSIDDDLGAQQKPFDLVAPQAKMAAPVMSDDLDWPADMLDPLGGLEDPLGDNSMDAFVNLDTLLMGDAFLDECDLSTSVEAAPEPVEVKPVIDFLDPDLAPVPAPSCGKATSKTAGKTTGKGKSKATNSRKRKAGKASSTSREAVKTSVFEIPVSAADHDYSSKLQKLSLPEDVMSAQTTTCSGTQSTSSASAQDKQAVRRMKNNVASKRSREQRKAKVVEMDKEADFLIEENERLKKKIGELEKQAKEMKALLVAKMAGKA